MPVYRLEKGSVQHQFYMSRTKFRLFAGGFANGKTAAMCSAALRLVVDYPGCNGLIARETFPKLNDTIRKEFFKWCPPEWVRRRPTKDDNTCYFHNGSMVNFRYINQRGKTTSDDGSTTSNQLSATYDWIIVDQIEDPGIVYKDWLDLMGRLRGSTPYRPIDGEEDFSMPRSGPRWLLATCNPTHNWVFKQLVQPLIIWRDKGIRVPELLVHPETQEPLIELFEDSTYGNSSNLEPDYLQSLEGAYRGQMKERYIYGKWSAFEGLVYPDYDNKRHAPTREEILAYLYDCKDRYVQLEFVEMYDYGMVSPSCYMLGVKDHVGRVFLIDGFYQPNYQIHEQAQRIKDIRAEYSGLARLTDRINADPDIFRRKVVNGHRDTGTSIAKLFGKHGIDMRPASNDITAGIAKVSAYIVGSTLAPSPFEDDSDSPGPMLYGAQELTFWHDEIMNYFWKKNPQGQNIDEPIDRDDHAMDATKYGLARLPDPSEIVIPAYARMPEYMKWHEVD